MEHRVVKIFKIKLCPLLCESKSKSPERLKPKTVQNNRYFISVIRYTSYDHSVIYSVVLGHVFTSVLQLHLTVKRFPVRQFTQGQETVL